MHQGEFMHVRSSGWRRRHRLGAAVAAASLVFIAAACGGDDSGSSDTTAASATTAAATETTAASTDTTASGGTATTAAGTATTAAPATTAGGAEGTPTKGGEATVLLFSEIGSLDPVRFTGSGGAEAQRAFANYGALMVYDLDSAKVNPVLADSITANADFTVWTLKLKDGVTFSDGSAYDAEAVKANWARAQDPANRSPSFTAMMAVSDLTVVDPTTLQITLSAPNSHFPSTISRAGLNYIASAQAIAAGTDLTSQSIGAGPYTLESWTRDDRMIMNANPDWKGSDGPYLDKLTFRVVGDEEQRINTFSTGDADAFYTATPESVKRAEDAVDGAGYTSVKVTTGQAFVFNNSAAPFSDLRVRTIFAEGVDWQAMADAVFGEGATYGQNFTVDGTDLYTPDAALPAYNPEDAQKLIDEYNAENGGGPLVINMLAFQQSLDQARAEYIQTALSQLKDIQVNITVNDSPTNIGLVLAGNYSVSSWGFPVVAPDPAIYNSAFSTALTNYSKYSNPDVDQWILDARTTDDATKALDDYHQVFAQLAKDIPYFPYVNTTNGFVTSPDLHGATVYEDGILRTDLIWKQS